MADAREPNLEGGAGNRSSTQGVHARRRGESLSCAGNLGRQRRVVSRRQPEPAVRHALQL